MCIYIYIYTHTCCIILYVVQTLCDIICYHALYYMYDLTAPSQRTTASLPTKIPMPRL